MASQQDERPSRFRRMNVFSFSSGLEISKFFGGGGGFAEGAGGVARPLFRFSDMLSFISVSSSIGASRFEEYSFAFTSACILCSNGEAFASTPRIRDGFESLEPLPPSFEPSDEEVDRDFRDINDLRFLICSARATQAFSPCPLRRCAATTTYNLPVSLSLSVTLTAPCPLEISWNSAVDSGENRDFLQNIATPSSSNGPVTPILARDCGMESRSVLRISLTRFEVTYKSSSVTLIVCEFLNLLNMIEPIPEPLRAPSWWPPRKSDSKLVLNSAERANALEFRFGAKQQPAQSLSISM
mmetsp:Transcript_4562/g.6824  ORF Transcript_4562/g.6824 Transcript_4562/m.6824 type:complete len:298 (-) Transcript_4562:816-1709(-)